MNTIICVRTICVHACRGGGAVGGGARVPAPERGLQGGLHVRPQLRAGVLAGRLRRRQLRRHHAPVQVHQGVLAS
jgi:hypothetical protein